VIPKVSIITATYNSGKTIEDTLRSVASQSYGNIEHIIIDGNSSDNTLELVSNFKHVSKILSEKDVGIYDAMNKGLKLATGDIIAILNSDDFYTSDDVISNVVKALENAEFDGTYGDLDYVHEDDTSKVFRKWKSGEYDSNSFYNGWMPPHPTLFVKRHVYNKCGLFNINLKSAADYEFILRAFMKNEFKFKYLPQVMVHMRIGGMSNASLKNRIKANNEDRLAWKINDLKPHFYTLYLKPLRKIFQFLK
jgi:glycosyltransferase involved in cell wall biosynthesis